MTGIPSVGELVVAAKRIVWKAMKEGNLSALTPRLVRVTLEKDYSLEGGTLDASEYRSAIKAATKAAIDEEPPISQSQVKEEPEDQKKAPSSAASASPKSPHSTREKRKLNGKSIVEDDDDIKDDDDEEVTPKKLKGKGKRVAKDSDYSQDEHASPKKKRKVALKPAKSTSKKMISGEEDENVPSKQASSRGKAKAKLKSKTVGSDEDEEEMEDHYEEEDEAQSKPPSSKSKQKPSKQFKSTEHVPTSDVEYDEPLPSQFAKGSSSEIKPKSPKPKESTAVKSLPDVTPKTKSVSKPSSAKGSKATRETESGNKSDSELSVVIDEPPKKRRKPAGDKKVTKPKEKKGTKSSVALSKDEETIKRLKSLVVACGTRKVWSKIFEGLDTPQQQIKKLKEILSELGMTGRLSMEQAKAIKEKRELEKELEDVQEFAKKVTSQPSRLTEAKKYSEEPGSDKGNDSDKAEDSAEEEVAAPRKRMNARRSIAAFLEDQSDEE